MSKRAVRRKVVKASAPVLHGRNERGNMLILGSVVMAIVGLALLIGYSYGGLVFTHNRLQTSADEIALAGARKLNDCDRIGQMNNMIARSRQMVFYSREQLDEATNNYPHLAAIASELLDDSKDMAIELEQQRKHLRNVALYESIVAMEKKFNQLKGTYPMSLPWLKVGKPQLVRMRLGRLDKIESPVEELKNIAELENWDKENAHIKNSPGLKLYKQGKNAKLPGAENVLDFKFSSLAPPVEKTVSPAHIALDTAFRTHADKEIDSSTEVELTLSVATGIGADTKTEMRAVSAAAATGASPQQ
ncbi:MAG: Tad domain-containing protein [Candidatus Melainabacteria bacterium]|nr:Tad domain-containing protein [Candidatus Melainabacteria bacterium]